MSKITKVIIVTGLILLLSNESLYSTPAVSCTSPVKKVDVNCSGDQTKQNKLILWMKFNKRLPTPPQFLDSSGNDNHGCAQINYGDGQGGAAQITSNGGGRQGEGLVCRSYHWVEVPGENLDLTGQVSVECWIKPSADIGQASLYGWIGIVSKGVSSAADVYGLRFKRSTSELQFVIRDRGKPYAASIKHEWKKDTWYHLKGTYDGKTVCLYENDIELAKTEHTGSIDQTCEPLYIGTGWGTDYGFSGIIDEVRIWGEKSKSKKDVGQAKGKNLIRLYPHESAKSVSIQHPAFPETLFCYVVPESMGNAEQGTIYSHGDMNPVVWTDPDEKGTIGFKGENDSAEFAVKLTPSEDSVEILQTVLNKTEKVWNHVYSFPCLATLYVPEIRDFDMTRTYIPIEGKGALTTREVFGKEVSRGICRMVKPTFGKHEFADQFPTSALKASKPYLFMVSKDKKWIAAMATKEAAFLFTNGGNSCIHACPYFGQINPGEEKTILSRIYIIKGTAEDLEHRYKQDFNCSK